MDKQRVKSQHRVETTWEKRISSGKMIFIPRKGLPLMAVKTIVEGLVRKAPRKAQQRPNNVIEEKTITRPHTGD